MSVTTDLPTASPAPANARPRRVTPPANRWVLIAISAAVLLLSVVLSVGHDAQQVNIPFLNRPLPPLCALKSYTGLDCPGCGLTRSFISLGHGRWREALAYNPAGPLVFLLIAAQIPWQAWQLRRAARGEKELELGWWGQAAIYATLVTLLLQWVVRQLGGW